MSEHAAAGSPHTELDSFDPPLHLHGIPVRDATVRAYAGDRIVPIRSTLDALALSLDESITGDIVVEVTPDRRGHSWIATLARHSRPDDAEHTVAFLRGLDPLQLQAAVRSLLSAAVTHEDPTAYVQARLPGQLGQLAVVIAANGALVVPAGAKSRRILHGDAQFVAVDHTPASFAAADHHARRLAPLMAPGKLLLVNYDPAQLVVATLVMHHWLAVPVTDQTVAACEALLARQRRLTGRAQVLGALALVAGLATPLTSGALTLVVAGLAAGLWSIARRWSWFVVRTGGAATAAHRLVWGNLHQHA
jgi:hypothetical protein